jgi:hypothetical protein
MGDGPAILTGRHDVLLWDVLAVEVDLLGGLGAQEITYSLSQGTSSCAQLAP